MDNNDRIINKIKKCLALSKSSNAHEAAIALKQAHKLMAEHKISAIDLSLSDIIEAETKGHGAKNYDWINDLHCMISDCFNCEPLGHKKWNESCRRYEDYVIFAGVKHKAEIASYAFSVLLRKLSKDRREYIKQNARPHMSRHDRTALGDAFARGWVESIRETVRRFAQTPPEEEKALIERYMERYANVKPAAIKTNQSARIDTYAAANQGYEQGKDVEIFHAMNKRNDAAQIGA